MENLTEIGLIGLGPMGENLSLNIANKGFKISVYNRTNSVTETFLKSHPHENIQGQNSLEKFVESIAQPRKIMLLVKAGEAVDKVIETLIPLLNKDDLIIDLGNSHFQETIRRDKELKEKGFKFIGSGISGGEKGALEGPSLMAGGEKENYKVIKNIFEKIAAKNFNNEPSVCFSEGAGSGHFIKMTHNGIEYAIMQIISEIYDIYRTVYHLTAAEIGEIFEQYNNGKLKSFLFEKSIEVLKKVDPESGKSLVDLILDSAEQKGTGRWTAITALEYGVNLQIITQSVFCRSNSSKKTLRENLSKIETKNFTAEMPLAEFKLLAEDAVYLAIIAAYSEGYDLLRAAEKENSWKLSLLEITRSWEGGCIIRADLLKILRNIFEKDINIEHLFLDVEIQDLIKKHINALSKLNTIIGSQKIYAPVLNTSLQYIIGLSWAKTGANLIQGLRDNFGAHGYKRLDKPGDFHAEW